MMINLSVHLVLSEDGRNDTDQEKAILEATLSGNSVQIIKSEYLRPRHLKLMSELQLLITEFIKTNK